MGEEADDGGTAKRPRRWGLLAGTLLVAGAAVSACAIGLMAAVATVRALAWFTTLAMLALASA